MINLFKLEVLRALRDPRYLVLAVVTPVGLYLLFTQLFGSHGERVEGLPQPVELMVGMAAYGAVWAVFSGTAPRIASERASGWLRQLSSTPLPGSSLAAAKVLGSLAAALPAMLLVSVTAVIVHGIRLDAEVWLEILGAMWLGALPLCLLGFALGYLTGPDAAYGVVMILYFAMGAIGGLWMPLSMLPSTMQDIGRMLPTHALADLGWKLAARQAPSLSSLAVLLAWTAGCALLSRVAYRFSTAVQ